MSATIDPKSHLDPKPGTLLDEKLENRNQRLATRNQESEYSTLHPQSQTLSTAPQPQCPQAPPDSGPSRNVPHSDSGSSHRLIPMWLIPMCNIGSSHRLIFMCHRLIPMWLTLMCHMGLSLSATEAHFFRSGSSRNPTAFVPDF